MFIRVKKRPNDKRSVQIVESYRRGDKVSQKITRHIGQALNDKEEMVLKELARSIIIEMENHRQPVLPLFSPDQFYDPELKKRAPANNNVILSNLREEQRIIVGIVDVFGKLYRDLSFDTSITKTRRDKQWNALLKACVLARLANPSSKRETASFLEQDYGIKIPLEKLYRMMDHVDSCEEEIKKKVASSTLDLFGQKLNVLFFDVTTLYFESIDQDALRDFGFSKDCKFKEVQVVLSLITTDHGMPVSYEVFPGNTFEGNTLIETIKKIRVKYKVDDISLVADRGMFSEKNLSLLENENIPYIVGAKLKSMDKKTKEKILEGNDYKADVVSEELHWMKELEHKKRRLIVGYSNKRARKDFNDRQRLIDRLMKKATDGKIQIKDIIPNYGTKKYLKVVSGTAAINEDKISADAQWDGLHGVISNVREKSPAELMKKYRGLWVIEESFRINKHDLKMRPIFHWKPQRVRAHIAICFLAYTLARQAVYRVNKQISLNSEKVITNPLQRQSSKQLKAKMSFRQLRNELLHAQSSLLIDIEEKKRYLIPSKITVNQKKIYKVFGLHRSETPVEVTSLKVDL